jgi:hypothetical protein
MDAPLFERPFDNALVASSIIMQVGPPVSICFFLIASNAKLFSAPLKLPPLPKPCMFLEYAVLQRAPSNAKPAIFPRNPLAAAAAGMDARFFNNAFDMLNPIDSAKHAALFRRAALPSACISSPACANIVQHAAVLAH